MECSICKPEMGEGWCVTPAIKPCSSFLTVRDRGAWVSGRSRSKTYGKDCAATCGATCPRRSFFGKDTDKSVRLFKDLRIMFASVEPSFSGKLSLMAITR